MFTNPAEITSLEQQAIVPTPEPGAGALLLVNRTRQKLFGSSSALLSAKRARFLMEHGEEKLVGRSKTGEEAVSRLAKGLNVQFGEPFASAVNVKGED